jgi:hypothetical protein
MKLPNTTMRSIFPALATLVAAASVHVANAAVITIPTSGVETSSEIPGFDRINDYLVDGSGLDADGGHTQVPDAFMWLSTGTDFGGDDPDPSATFILGDVHTINSFTVWNYNEVNLPLRGVNEVSIEYGTTAALGSTVAGITNFAVAPGADGYKGEVFDSFTPFDAKYIKFNIDSNHGGDNNFYGLSEVQFDGTVVPEPSSLAFLGLSGLLLLRRQRISA